jgi:dienelactone hydrolase
MIFEIIKNKRTAIFLYLLLTFSCHVLATPDIIPLYQGKAPGTDAWNLKESVVKRDDGTLVYHNVVNPEVHVYLPEPAKANGSAAIYLPGGAMRILSVGDSVEHLIKQLNEQGMAVFLLKYRVLQQEVKPFKPRSKGAPIKWPKLVINKANANPAPHDQALNEVTDMAVADTLATMALLKQRSQEWNISGDKIGLIGTSAGGGVALAAYLEHDPNARPAFIVSDYGPSLRDVTVYSDAPPLFIATETYHGPVTDGLIELMRLWRDADKPVEMHMFSVPSFVMPSSMWSERLIEWLKEQSIF